MILDSNVNNANFDPYFIQQQAYFITSNGDSILPSLTIETLKQYEILLLKHIEKIK